MGDLIFGQQLMAHSPDHPLLPTGTLQVAPLISRAHVGQSGAPVQPVVARLQIERNVLFEKIFIGSTVNGNLHATQGIHHLLETLKIKAQKVVDGHVNLLFQQGGQEIGPRPGFVLLTQKIHHIDFVGLVAGNLL